MHTHLRLAHPVTPSPTEEDLVVLYVPDRSEWEQRCAALRSAGFEEREPFNPDWSGHGRAYRDADGYQVVVQQAEWSPGCAS